MTDSSFLPRKLYASKRLAIMTVAALTLTIGTLGPAFAAGGTGNSPNGGFGQGLRDFVGNIPRGGPGEGATPHISPTTGWKGKVNTNICNYQHVCK